MNREKAIEDLVASRNIMQSNIELFHKGHKDVYRVIAVELRKLLCDGRSSLLPRLFSTIKLHPLRGASPGSDLSDLMERAVFRMPSLVEFDGKGGSKIIELFDPTKEPINIDVWLSQSLFNKDITIENLIRSVADKEAAHSDKYYNETLKFTKSIKLVSEDIHKQHIVAIGEYVLEVLNPVIN